MRISVRQFTTITLLCVIAITYIGMGFYFIQQQERTAKVIHKSIYSDLYSLSYTLSKELANKSKEQVPSIRPILDRTAIDNDFLEAVLILQDNNLIATTDPFYDKKIIKNVEYFENISMYDEVRLRTYAEHEVSFYRINKKYSYRLVFIIDKNEVLSYFTEYNVTSLIYLLIAPLIVFAMIFILMKYLLAIPLEKLRQFAYYQNKVPSSFLLKELETIRHSMVQTFSRLEQEKNELYIMSRTDELSGLANRNALDEYLKHLIETSKRKKTEFAFLFLDLDDFKSVNDSLGHDVGDELLKHLATVISSVIRDNDCVARIGGDEFIVVLQDYKSLVELTTIIKRIQDSLSQKMVVLTNPISINSSIGVALYPQNGTDILSLMKHSDIAMYEAKNKGKAQYHFFTDDLNQRVQDVITLDKDMRQALVNKEYKLFYQPKVDILTNEVVGVEALIRWDSPLKGLINPLTFIPLAEENNFILELGDWVIEEAIKQSKKWMDEGKNISISINVSTKQLLDMSFVDKVASLLKQYNVDPKQIDLEITEYLLLKFNENNSNVLDKLREIGLSISLDDFGTGYSSLSYLKKFSIDYLKIDKSFMDDYDDKDGAIFIETIVKMGQTLNLVIIAEGVETAEQVAYLKSIRCDQYQGYYFSKPLPAEKLFL